jgi:flagellar basal-body rod protein FlgB
VKRLELFDRNITILNKGLDAYAVRAKALANNISNVNTPKYKREDIKFEETLAAAIDGNLSGVAINAKITDKSHFVFGTNPIFAEVGAEVIKEEETFMRNDGNNVDIERETSEFAKNNIRYQFATNRMSQNFMILKSVIKGR